MVLAPHFLCVNFDAVFPLTRLRFRCINTNGRRLPKGSQGPESKGKEVDDRTAGYTKATAYTEGLFAFPGSGKYTLSCHKESPSVPDREPGSQREKRFGHQETEEWRSLPFFFVTPTHPLLRRKVPAIPKRASRVSKRYCDEFARKQVMILKEDRRPG